MKKIISLGLVLGSLPVVAFAAATNAFDIIGVIAGIISVIMPVLVALAAVFFIWGVITYIFTKDEEQKKKSRSRIINGLIGLFVIIAFWGILAVIMNTFGLTNKIGGNPVPCNPIPGSLNPC
jgi:hypothetical protein